ncbi:DUF4136 domain-containing protein [Algoriphagus winogradskyi]|jgi:hypothetical protein|uniref:DUF4136 domain-containing protein n=1 Tax=Algoriphagus winogradskyi TaxID=237017 RepID=A0ABY1NXS2_9BACT|nr:DUF4136 domain-containing protein [Algoriphagus winogradskyi]SMP20512.1 protein of unknown function [Algoriphagus winogradskyi]
MLKKLQLLGIGVLGWCMLLSCTPDGAEYIDELDVVYTNYDVNHNFASNNTFAVPDKIVKIEGQFINGAGGNYEPEYVSPGYTAAILASIRTNMRNAGYTEVDKSANPDLIILPSVIQTDQLFFYYDWWYWNWFYPGWGPGWSWYYPGYYPPQVSSVRTGTVLLQMTDPNNISENDQIPVVWTSVINGLLEGSTSAINSRINTSIDQAFSQSPYLAK